jgi:hypothetical protein
MQRKTFVGTIASVSALGIRDEFTNELKRLNISILIPVSYVDGKPLREPVWTNVIISPEKAAELGLEIKAKSLKTDFQHITEEELAQYGLKVTDSGTVGLTISYDAVGLNKASARQLMSEGLPPRTVYPASCVANIQLDTSDNLITEFDTVDDVKQTEGYRPPSAVSNFVNRMFNKDRTEQAKQTMLDLSLF